MSNQIVVTDAIRTKLENEKYIAQGLGAALNSKHLSGKAVDIRDPGLPENIFEQLARESGFDYIKTDYEDKHIHLQCK